MVLKQWVNVWPTDGETWWSDPDQRTLVGLNHRPTGAGGEGRGGKSNED